MPICALRDDTAARCAHDEALLNQERLEHVFDRVAFFADCGCKRVEADRAAAELLQNGQQQPPVHRIEPFAIDVQHIERAGSHLRGDAAVAAHLGKVAHTAQQPVRDPSADRIVI